MRLFTVPAIVLVTSLLAPAPASMGGPFNSKWVASDAQWLVHIDVDAMLQAKLVKHVLDNPGRFHIEMDGIDEFKQHTGLDPLKDVHGLTGYGVGNPDEGNFVLVAEVGPAIEQTVEKVKAGAPEYREVTSDGYTVHSFKEEHATLFFSVREARPNAPDKRVVVMSHDLGKLITGLEVIDGKAPSLGVQPAEGANARPTPGPNSIAFVAASDLSWIDDDDDDDHDDPASALLRSSQQVSIDVGENAAETYIDGSLAVGSTEDATNVADMLRGFIALGRILSKNEPDMAGFGDLFDGITLSSNGNRVRVSIRQPTARLIQALDQAAAMHNDDDDNDDDDDHDEDGNADTEVKNKHSMKIHEH